MRDCEWSHILKRSWDWISGIWKFGHPKCQILRIEGSLVLIRLKKNEIYSHPFCSNQHPEISSEMARCRWWCIFCWRTYRRCLFWKIFQVWSSKVILLAEHSTPNSSLLINTCNVYCLSHTSGSNSISLASWPTAHNNCIGSASHEICFSELSTQICLWATLVFLYQPQLICCHRHSPQILSWFYYPF